MSLDLSQYEIKPTERHEEVSPQQEQLPIEQTSEPLDLNKYAVNQEETWAQWGTRQAARAGSRIAETVVGFPGDLVKFEKWLESKFPEPKHKIEPNIVRRTLNKAIEMIPSSHEVKEVASKITSGYTDPQNAQEEFGDSIFELATALSFGKDPVKMQKAVANIGKAFTAKGAAKVAESLGAGESGQFATEIGALILLGTINKTAADKMIADKYATAKSLIPEEVTVSTKALEKDLAQLKQELGKGIPTPTKNVVMNSVDDLAAKASEGTMPMREVVQTYHDINEHLTSKKLFGDTSKSERRLLKHRFDSLKDVVDNQIKDYAKYNPDFNKNWREANQAYATIQRSKAVSNWVESVMGKLPAKIVGSMALEILQGYPEVAAGTAATVTGLKTGEYLYRFAKSPVLREHYNSAIKAASAENIPAFVKSVDNMNKELSKSFE